jgi:hypothetical protein
MTLHPGVFSPVVFGSGGARRRFARRSTAHHKQNDGVKYARGLHKTRRRLSSRRVLPPAAVRLRLGRVLRQGFLWRALLFRRADARRLLDVFFRLVGGRQRLRRRLRPWVKQDAKGRGGRLVFHLTIRRKSAVMTQRQAAARDNGAAEGTAMKMRGWLCVALALAIAGFAGACQTYDFTGNAADDDSSPADDDASPADDDATAIPPVLGPIAAVVPGAGLPPEVAFQHSNNNLDVVDHNGVIFLAWRTAPTHFASTETKIYIVSSADQVAWNYEAEIAEGSDLREPRLLSWNGRLFLYFGVLGKNPFAFNPEGMMVAEYKGPANWTEPQLFYQPGFIPWRTKVVDGKPYMTAYVGGGNAYSLNSQPMYVHWLTTADGVNWTPVVPGQPVVLTGGNAETDFVFLDDGSLVAVADNEEGDAGGFGTKICKADAASLGDWRCVNDPKLYDSPLLFRHNEGIYLIGRRNLNDDGDFDLGYGNLPLAEQRIVYDLAYWLERKRCSLWQIDPDTLLVSWVLDLPSRGDTCYPGVLYPSADEYTVYDYTSPLDGPDVFWLEGQLNPTQIIRQTMTFQAGTN